MPTDPSSAPPADASGGGDAAHPPTIVGIGASAGGLAALKTFFRSVPPDSGVIWVVVVHLSPKHESHLAELLQPGATLPVLQVTETVRMEPDRVYVIPPGAHLNAVDTHLRLSPLEPQREVRAPIDHFFRTLARTHDGNAVGIVLTGTGSDGTLGLREIKEKGGLTVVQAPSDAEYDGMPQNAIASGAVDLVLPLDQIPGAVLRFAKVRPRVGAPGPADELTDEDARLLQRVYAQVRSRTGRDFSRYKRNTVLRRITRRMQLRGVVEFPAYLELLRQDGDEVRSLADDLLITVTAFFRDPDVFETLKTTVIPTLFEGRNPGQTVRVWSVGCATGEEAYSLAMLLVEEAETHDAPPRIQIFASDLHEGSLDRGRDGFYQGDIAIDVGPERLERFFSKEAGGYRVRQSLRELVVFTPHNLLADPPFSRLDLVACRNLLIYLDRSVQRDVMELFHYALKPEGFLVLGSSETVDSAELFAVKDKKRRIYQRRSVPAPEPRLPVFPLSRLPSTRAHAPPEQEDGQPLPYRVLHDRISNRYGPPSILLSGDDRIVHLSDRAGRYFVLSGGEVTSNVYKLIRDEMRIELRAALHEARKTGEPFRSRPQRVRFNGASRDVSMEVYPATSAGEDGYALVVFTERPPAVQGALPEDSTPVEGGDRERLQDLEAQLTGARERLQSIIEEYETSQEELRASNEELQSSNEELRSTMEELETSKEELQSMNEELQTVNQENRHKVEELSQLSGDLQNLLAATDIATLFLDRDLRILRFTPRVGDLFNVRLADRGRSILDFTHRLRYDGLTADARRVLERLIPVEREVQDAEGRWYLTRILPYRSQDDRIEGTVVTFVDITVRKQAEEEQARSAVYAESIVETLHEPLLVLQPDLRVKSVNGAFCTHFKVERSQTVGRRIYDLGNGQWDIPELRTLLEDVLPENHVFNDYEVAHEFQGLGRRVMLLNARRLDHLQLILVGIRDITERKAAEEELQSSEARHAFLVRLNDALRPLEDTTAIREEAARLLGEHLGVDRAYYVEVDEKTGEARVRWDYRRGDSPSLAGSFPLSEVGWTVPYLRRGETVVVGDTQSDALVPESDRQWMADLRMHAHISAPIRKDTVLRGALCVTEATARPWSEADVELVEEVAERIWSAVQRSHDAEALRQSETRYRTLFESIDDGYCIIEVLFDEDDQPVDYRFLEVNPSFEAHTGLTGVVGRRIREFVPDHEQHWYDIYGRIARTGEPERFVEEARELGGRWYDVYALRVGEAADNRVAVVFNDISEWRRAELAAHQREVEFLALIRASTDVVYRMSADGSEMRRLEGRGFIADQSTPSGTWLEEYIPEEARPGVRQAIAEAIRTRSVFELEHRVLQVDGTVGWTLSRAVPILDEHGEIVEWIGAATDITERKQGEEALEQRVAERTREVRELAETLGVAEQQERQRLSRLLHDDLQQLLYGIQMKVTMAVEHAKQGDLSAATEGGRRSLQLLDEAITRTRQLTVDLNPPILEGEGLVGAIEWLRTQMRDLHELDVEIHSDGEVDVRPPDLRILLFQVTRELLFNVAKHADTDRARVDVWTEDDRVLVSVTDHGAGFEGAVLAAGRARGGLGLFSARERLRLRGGDLEIESTPREGTRAVASAPLAPER